MPIPRRGRTRSRASGKFRRSRSSTRSRSALGRSRPRNAVQTGYLKTRQKIWRQETLDAGSSATPFNFVFKLADIPQSAEFVRLFDSYRINNITISAAPMTNSSLTINPAYKMLWAVDLDDDNAPTLGSMLQRSNVHIKTVTSGGSNPQVFYMKCRPRYLTEIYKTALSTGYGQGARKQWLDCADPEIPHYGIKVLFDTNPQLGSDVVWQFFVNYDIEFKSLR